jgi:hypothetical protein
MRLFCFLLSAVVSASAQTAALPPLSGYVYNAASRTLHALRGVPGSAYVGAAIATDLDGAWPAPAGAVAIAIHGEETVLLRGLDRGEPETDAATGILSRPSMVSWSPAGTAAAVYGNGQVQVVRVTAGRISADVPLDTDSLGDVTAIAINDSGRVAVASAGGIYLFDSAGHTLLLDAAGVRSLRFGAGNTLYAAAADRLLWLDTESGASGVLIADVRIDAFALSRQTGAFYLADSGRQVLEIYDRSGNKTETIALDRVTAPQIAALVRESLFLLSAPDAGGSPAIVLQASEHPSVLFVPADSSTL